MPALDKNEIQQSLMLLLLLLERKKVIPPLTKEARDSIVNNVTDKILKGDIKITSDSLKSRATIKLLSVALVAATIAHKTPDLDTKNALNETMTLMFKDQNNLTPLERKKLSIGLAYVVAMENDPKLKLNLGLAFKALEGKKLTPEESKELTEDLEKVLKNANENPNTKKLAPELISKLMNVIKNKIKNPNDNTKAEDELLQSMYGIGVGPLPVLAGNLLGVANTAVFSMTPIAQLDGDLISDTQGATGVEILAADRDLAAEPDEPMIDALLGIIDVKGKHVSAIQDDPAIEPESSPSSAPEEATEEESYRPPSPFDISKGPKGPYSH